MYHTIRDWEGVYNTWEAIVTGSWYQVLNWSISLKVPLFNYSTIVHTLARTLSLLVWVPSSRREQCSSLQRSHLWLINANINREKRVYRCERCGWWTILTILRFCWWTILKILTFCGCTKVSIISPISVFSWQKIVNYIIDIGSLTYEYKGATMIGLAFIRPKSLFASDY